MYEDEYLEHHGILGQKWGVRRFQKEDGTRTAAGKARERDDSSGPTQNGGGSGHRFHVNKKAVAVAAGVAVGAALMAHPATRKALATYGKTAMKALPGVASKAGKVVGKAGVEAGHALGESGKRVGNAMLDAALLSYGTVQIVKLDKKLNSEEITDQATKDRNKVIFDTAKAGIEAATNPKNLSTSSSSNSGKGGNKGGTVGKEVTDKLGAPSHKGVDKQSKEWGELFKDVSDPEVRGTIKSLASQGYDMNQLQEYKKQFAHSDLEDWILKQTKSFGSYIIV